MVAAEESQESSNTSMRLVIADAACQRVMWDDRVEHGTVIYNTILQVCIVSCAHMFGDTKCCCRRTGVDPSWSW